MFRKGERPLEKLAADLELAWERDTSSDPERWSEQNPAWGQCAVTALVIQDIFGGELLRSQVGRISHYWNRLPSGQEVDLTRRQFGADVELRNIEPRSREYVLSFPETQRRYHLLASKLSPAPAPTTRPQ